jgi:hypothetical protein
MAEQAHDTGRDDGDADVSGRAGEASEASGNG